MSPKPPRYSVSPGLIGVVSEIKVVVDETVFRTDVVEALSRLHPTAVVCLQPEWTSFEQTAAAAAAAVMTHPDWRLSLQLHKVLGLR